jgi:acyl-CoA dehydrogenase
MDIAFTEIQKGFDGIYANFDVPVIGWFFREIVGVWSSFNAIGRSPRDKHSHKIVNCMLNNQEQRLRLTEGIFSPQDANEQLAILEHTYIAVKAAEGIDKKIRSAVKSKKIPKQKGRALYESALQNGVINKVEFETLHRAEELRWAAIQVDDFSEAEYREGVKVKTPGNGHHPARAYGS